MRGAKKKHLIRPDKHTNNYYSIIISLYLLLILCNNAISKNSYHIITDGDKEGPCGQRRQNYYNRLSMII